MNQVNYQETIVIPTLQKKVQDLQNTNLVLEVSLLVEQAKIKDLNTQLQKNIVDETDKEQSLRTLKQKINELHDATKLLEQKNVTLTNELNREKSLKENILSEFNSLKREYSILEEQIKNKIKKS